MGNAPAGAGLEYEAANQDSYELNGKSGQEKPAITCDF